MLQPLFEDLDRLDDVETLPRAGRARHDIDPAMAEPQRLQYVEADADLLFGFRGERDPDRVTDTGPQQHAHADGRLDRTGDHPAGLGDSEMQRIVARVG